MSYEVGLDVEFWLVFVLLAGFGLTAINFVIVGMNLMLLVWDFGFTFSETLSRSLLAMFFIFELKKVFAFELLLDVLEGHLIRLNHAFYLSKSHQIFFFLGLHFCQNWRAEVFFMRSMRRLLFFSLYFFHLIFFDQNRIKVLFRIVSLVQVLKFLDATVYCDYSGFNLRF